MGKKREDLMIEASFRENREIRAEYARLLKLYGGIPQKKLSLVKRLIVRAAFMGITLGQLEKDISVEGVVEEYKNGANQKGIKKSSKAEVYNAMVKNYTAVMKQLSELIESGGNEPDDFDSF